MKKRAFSILLIFLMTLLAGCDTCNRPTPPDNTKPPPGKKTVKQKYEPIKKLQSNVSADLNAVSFLTPARGIAVGENGTVLITRNGGFNWSTVSSATVRTLYGAVIVDSVLAVAVGDSCTIIRSKDAGLTWDSVASYNVNYKNTLRSVAFYDNLNGYAVGDGIIFRTTNGGVTWSLVFNNPYQDLYGITYNSKNIPYITGTQGLILTGTDIADIWDSTNITTNNLSSIHFAQTGVPFAHSKKGFAVGDGGVIYETTDDGQNWAPAANSDTASLKSVFLTSPNWGHAVGNGGTILRYNGTGWQKLPVITAARLNGVDPTWNPITTCVGEDGLVMEVYPPQVNDVGSTLNMEGESECIWHYDLHTGNLRGLHDDSYIQYVVFEVCSSIEQSDMSGVVPTTGWAQMERYFSKSLTLNADGHYSSGEGNLSPLTLLMDPSGNPTTGIVSCFYLDSDGNPYIFDSYQVICP
jgi:photosystem II stability/assembly factor-like uncharacterized protein